MILLCSLAKIYYFLLLKDIDMKQKLKIKQQFAVTRKTAIWPTILLEINFQTKQVWYYRIQSSSRMLYIHLTSSRQSKIILSNQLSYKRWAVSRLFTDFTECQSIFHSKSTLHIHRRHCLPSVNFDRRVNFPNKVAWANVAYSTTHDS